MIFVTVGTHEQPFDRLIAHLDKMKKDKTISEEVLIQTGYSTYVPNYCQWQKMFSYQEMINYIKEAHIVITHGGPSSFIMPLQIGKIPIVVPRQKQLGEHINNHQVDFIRKIADIRQNVIVAESMEDLERAILNYDELSKKIVTNVDNNTAEFCEKIEAIVNELFKDKGIKNHKG